MRVETICVVQMNQAPGGDDSDNARPQRHLIIDKDDVGTTPFRENTAIGETCSSGGRRRNQVQAAVSGSTPSAARRNAANNGAG
jgi:hypothetical protein